jgi:hypothetical protein
MCLIIHKPAGVAVPRQLLQSAAERNYDGFGLMGFGDGGRLRITRRATTQLWELLSLYEDYATDECVIHLRRTTRGLSDSENTHPFRITDQIFMVHNGTLAVQCHSPGRSDTWHLVEDHLKPILQASPEKLYDPTFQALLAGLSGPENKFVFMDAARRQTLILNRAHGVDLDSLWLSNSRWFDAARFGLVQQGLHAFRTKISRFGFVN